MLVAAGELNMLAVSISLHILATILSEKKNELKHIRFGYIRVIGLKVLFPCPFLDSCRNKCPMVL